MADGVHAKRRQPKGVADRVARPSSSFTGTQRAAGMPAFLRAPPQHEEGAGAFDHHRASVESSEPGETPATALPMFLQRAPSETAEPEIQPKLIVGDPQGPLEQEAERVSSVVQRMPASDADAASPEPPVSEAAATPQVQRSCESCGATTGSGGACESCGEAPMVQRAPSTMPAGTSVENPRAVIEQPDSGAPIPTAVRKRIEPALGQGLGHVRVHSDGRAQGAAKALRAKAFTHRNHIWLGPGQSANDAALMAHESTHVIQQGHGQAPDQVQRAPADHRHPEDGAVPRQRLRSQVTQEVGDLPESSPAEARRRSQSLSPSQVSARGSSLTDEAQPPVDRPAQERPGIDSAADQTTRETESPPEPVAEGEQSGMPDDASQSGESALPQEAASTAAQALFGQAQAVPEPPEETPVEPIPAAMPTDAGGEPVPANPDAEMQVQDLAQRIQMLRSQGTTLRRRAAVERRNANVLRGNITLIQGGIETADQSVSTARDHSQYRRGVVEQGRAGLQVSEDKQRTVADGAPGYVDKANEGQRDSEPMASEASQTAADNRANRPEDSDAAEKSERQGRDISQVDQGAQSMDSAMTSTAQRGASLIQDAAAAAQTNEAVSGNLDGTDADLDQADTKLDEMKGQTDTARGQVEGLANQPDVVQSRADQLDRGALDLIARSFELERDLRNVPRNAEMGMRSVPEVRPYQPDPDEEPMQSSLDGEGVAATPQMGPLEQEAVQASEAVAAGTPETETPGESVVDLAVEDEVAAEEGFAEELVGAPRQTEAPLDEAELPTVEPEVPIESELPVEGEAPLGEEENSPPGDAGPGPSIEGEPIVQRTPETRLPVIPAALALDAAEPAPTEETPTDEGPAPEDTDAAGDEDTGEPETSGEQGAEGEQGPALPQPMTQIPEVPERTGYDAREQIDLVGELPGWLTGREPETEQERARRTAQEQERQRDEVADITRRFGPNLERATVLDRLGFVTGALSRDLGSALSNISWPSWGDVPGMLLGIFDPRGPLTGVVSGLQMMVSGGANLLSAEQWRRDPLGNLLKSSADIATGLTVILGSITALAGVIAAIMTAITILSLGFAAPVTGPIISFCTSVMVTVGGWTIAVGKVALVLQALALIKNLIDAATANTAAELQSETDQIRADVRQGGNIIMQIGTAKLAQIGGRGTASQIQRAGGGTRFAGRLGGAPRAAGAFRAARNAGRGRLGSSLAAGRSVAGMWGSRAVRGVRGAGEGLGRASGLSRMRSAFSGARRGGASRVGAMRSALRGGRRLWSGRMRGAYRGVRDGVSSRMRGPGRLRSAYRGARRGGGSRIAAMRAMGVAARRSIGGRLRGAFGSPRGAWRRHSGFDSTRDAWRHTTGRPPRPARPPGSNLADDAPPNTTARPGSRRDADLIDEGGRLPHDATPSRAHVDAELDVVRRSQTRPSRHPDYVDEVDIRNGHVWRRRHDGTWCRFSGQPKFCGTTVTPASGPLRNRSGNLDEAAHARRTQPHGGTPDRLDRIIRGGGNAEEAGVLARVRRQNPHLDEAGLRAELARHLDVRDATLGDVRALEGQRAGPAVSRGMGGPGGSQLTPRRTNFRFEGGVPRFKRLLDSSGVDDAYREIARVYADAGQRIHPRLERRLRDYLERIRAARAGGAGGGLSNQRGVPGTHAEVQSYNDALWAGDGDVLLGVRRLSGNTLGGAGDPFIRCPHCREITRGVPAATDDF